MAKKKDEEVVVEIIDPQHSPTFGEETGEEAKEEEKEGDE